MPLDPHTGVFYALHGQGRHTLWSGDLGLACVLWGCVTGQPGFPSLDAF